mgnify:CR=1 FL=1
MSKTLIVLMVGMLAVGCGKQEQTDANESTPTTNTNKVNGTTAKPVKELTLEEKVVGTYEFKVDGDTIYHLDLYRLKEENEAYDIGIEEILDCVNLKFIEWPQKINNLIDNNVHSAKISSINESKRKLEFI